MAMLDNQMVIFMNVPHSIVQTHDIHSKMLASCRDSSCDSSRKEAFANQHQDSLDNLQIIHSVRKYPPVNWLLWKTNIVSGDLSSN